MIIVRSVHGVPIRLTAERWNHISSRHPEMGSEREKILETVAAPDIIQAGDFGELLAVRHWPSTPLTSKHLVVAYREIDSADGFIMTAYLTSRPSKARTTVWTT